MADFEDLWRRTVERFNRRLLHLFADLDIALPGAKVLMVDYGDRCERTGSAMSDYNGAGTRVLESSDFERLTPRFMEIRDYLAVKARQNQLPRRSDFDPLDFPQLLGFFNLVSVVRDGSRLTFRFDLVGTEQTIVSGRDVTGRFVEDAVLDEAVEMVNRNMALAVETRKPVYSRFTMPQPEHDFMDSERVYFPLASDGTEVDRILILYHYFRQL